ncbi:MAG: hypothetical protein ACREDR_33130 [Blastocatellia bacterium]
MTCPRALGPVLVFLCVAPPTSSGLSNHPSNGLRHLASARLMHTSMILWKGGLVETITRCQLGDRKIWRVTHYPQDPTQSDINDFDLYDLDQQTFAPLRSVMNTADYRLELIFTEKEVTLRKTTAQGGTTEQIPLSTAVQPEGPGLDVFVAMLPLKRGYKVQYSIVDGWGGHRGTRVKAVTLSVLGQITKDTHLGKRSVYNVLIKPDDDSFRIREEVLAESPHLPVSVEFTRDGKTYPMSEVIGVASQD